MDFVGLEVVHNSVSVYLHYFGSLSPLDINI